MMRVAILSDVHANLPALQAALADLERRGAEVVLVAGDVVGDGRHPSEVVAMLRRWAIPTIRGNVERKVIEAAALTDTELALRTGKKKQADLVWTARRLGHEGLEWLRALPASLELHLAGARLLLVHGSPLGDTDYVYPSLTAWALAAKLGADRPDVLACGHSHIPFTRRIAGVRVVNAGSVGRPVDGDPRGSYALLDLDRGALPRARIVRFPYPGDGQAAEQAPEPT
jgi:putative phosphoesterase